MWRGYPVEGYYDKCWLMGLWSTQAKVVCIVLKPAWHWGSNSSVENEPLGEPGHTPLHVRLPSAWGSVDGYRMISPFSWEGSFFWGLRHI